MSDLEDFAPMFQEPDDFYPPTPPPTTETYTTRTGDVITLHLVGHSPLEAHHLWNGARAAAAHFEAHPGEVAGRTVLELGAGAGLPSLVAAALGARRVVVTDYPDPDLVENMWRNVRGCDGLIPRRKRRARRDGAGSGSGDGEDDEDGELPIVACGYVWGADPKEVLGYLDGWEEVEDEKEEGGEGRARGFDVLILADLLFRHAEHGKMIRSIQQTLKKTRESKAFVVFTSYRPWLQHKDLAFFDLARESGFEVEKIFENKLERPMFENDPGDQDVLKTVTGWVLRWPEDACRGTGS